MGVNKYNIYVIKGLDKVLFLWMDNKYDLLIENRYIDNIII